MNKKRKYTVLYNHYVSLGKDNRYCITRVERIESAPKLLFEHLKKKFDINVLIVLNGWAKETDLVGYEHICAIPINNL